MFVYAPDIKIAEHPIRFGSGDWTAVTGFMTGTFTQADADRRRQDHPAHRQVVSPGHGDDRPLEGRHDGPRVAVLGQPGLHEAARAREVTPGPGFPRHAMARRIPALLMIESARNLHTRYVRSFSGTDSQRFDDGSARRANTTDGGGPRSPGTDLQRPPRDGVARAAAARVDAGGRRGRHAGDVPARRRATGRHPARERARVSDRNRPAGGAHARPQDRALGAGRRHGSAPLRASATPARRARTCSSAISCCPRSIPIWWRCSCSTRSKGLTSPEIAELLGDSAGQRGVAPAPRARAVPRRRGARRERALQKEGES